MAAPLCPVTSKTRRRCERADGHDGDHMFPALAPSSTRCTSFSSDDGQCVLESHHTGWHVSGDGQTRWGDPLPRMGTPGEDPPETFPEVEEDPTRCPVIYNNKQCSGRGGHSDGCRFYNEPLPRDVWAPAYPVAEWNAYAKATRALKLAEENVRRCQAEWKAALEAMNAKILDG